jgi:hypothetical protein
MHATFVYTWAQNIFTKLVLSWPYLLQLSPFDLTNTKMPNSENNLLNKVNRAQLHVDSPISTTVEPRSTTTSVTRPPRYDDQISPVLNGFLFNFH